MVDSRATIEVPAELTFATVRAVHRRFESEVKAGMVLDLQKVRRIDHAGLSLLVYWLNSSSENAARVTAVNVSGQLRELAELNHLAGLFAPAGLDSDNPKPIS